MDRVDYLIGADIETYGNQPAKLLFGAWDAVQLNQPGKNTKHFVKPRGWKHKGLFNTLDQFADLLERFRTARFVFHNAQFDVRFLQLHSGPVSERGWYVDVVKSLNVCAGEMRPFKMVLVNDKLCGRVEIVDSYDLYSMPLRDVGESLGFPKGDFDCTDLSPYAPYVAAWGEELVDCFKFYNEPKHIQEAMRGSGMMRWEYPAPVVSSEGPPGMPPMSELVKYCQRDALIARKAVEAINQFCYDEIQKPAGFTISLTARRLLADKLGEEKKEIWAPHNKPAHQAEVNWSMLRRDIDTYLGLGGRVEAFWQGRPETMSYKNDVNSLYPSNMCERLPVHPADRCSLKLTDQLADPCTLVKGWFKLPDDDFIGGEAVKLPDHGLISPAGSIYTTMYAHWIGTFADRYGVAKGRVYRREDVEVDVVWPMVSSDCFKEFIEWNNKAKEQASRDGDKVKRQLRKILANAIYGSLMGGYNAEVSKYPLTGVTVQARKQWLSIKNRDKIRRGQSIDAALSREEEQWIEQKAGHQYVVNYWHAGRIKEAFDGFPEPTPQDRLQRSRCKFGEKWFDCLRQLEGDEVVYSERRPLKPFQRWSQSANPLTASYITSLGRLKMNLVAREVLARFGRVYYMDTDSLFTSWPLPGRMLDDTKLGYFALEEVYETGDRAYLTNKVTGSTKAEHQGDSKHQTCRGIKGWTANRARESYDQQVFPKYTSALTGPPSVEPEIKTVQKQISVKNRKRITEGGTVPNPEEVTGRRTLPPIGYNKNGEQKWRQLHEEPKVTHQLAGQPVDIEQVEAYRKMRAQEHTDYVLRVESFEAQS